MPTPSWEPAAAAAAPPAPPAPPPAPPIPAAERTIIAPPHEATTVIPAYQPPATGGPNMGGETQPIVRAMSGAGPQAQLTIDSGPDAGNNHRAGDSALRVGRSPDNDLILRDPATSGHHARVERRGQQFWIVDLGSTNGTLVNGEPIQEKELNHGDRITIGQNAVSFAIVEA
ncbi:MAG TPA: FHA domain-containing protein [Candidatus Dormibacteraeota bacterium]